MAEHTLGYKGYCTHNCFGTFQIPVPVQNLLLRDYANKNKFSFKLSVNELFFPNCFLNFDNLLKQLPQLDGVLMASVFMLPEDTDKRETIYNTVINFKSSLHFVMENLVINDESSRNYVEAIFRINATLSKCPTSIPNELLPDYSGQEYFTSNRHQTK